jgi:hypothetical protein
VTVVKTIGQGGGFSVTPDYTDINSWDSYLNGLGTLTEDQVARVLWASAGNELKLSEQTLDGSTPSTFSIILEAGDAAGNQGGSFKDHVSAASNPLRYSASAGACIRTSGNITGFLLTMNDPNTAVRHLQFKKGFAYNGGIDGTDSAVSGRSLSKCIIKTSSVNSIRGIRIAGFTVENCLLYQVNNAPSIGIDHSTGTSEINNCTIANLAASGTSIGVQAGYGTANIRNVAVYGYDTDIDTTGAAVSARFCATDKASASSNMVGGAGTSIQYSIVGTTEWESVSADAPDFRVKSTSAKLKDNGTSTGTPTDDIIGQSRS